MTVDEAMMKAAKLLPCNANCKTPRGVHWDVCAVWLRPAVAKALLTAEAEGRVAGLLELSQRVMDERGNVGLALDEAIGRLREIVTTPPYKCIP